MKCNFCKSEWFSESKLNNCPFCGRELILEAEIKKDINLKETLKIIIDKYSIEVFKNPKRVIAFVKDYVTGYEKDVRLFKIACDSNILNYAYDIVVNDISKESLYRETCKKKLEVDFFIASESAEYIVNLIFDAVTNKNTIINETKEEKIQEKTLPAYNKNDVNKKESALSESEILEIIRLNKRVDSKALENIFDYGVSKFDLSEKQRKLCLKAGQKDYKSEYHDLCIKIFKYASENGMTKASDLLGDIYYFGQGCNKNDNIAEAYYRQAAFKGDHIAEYKLGLFYRLQNKELLSITWLDKARKGGVISADTIFSEEIKKLHTLGNREMDIEGVYKKDIIGDLTGDILGIMYGNITGNMNGDIVGMMNGKIYGNLNGNIRGILGGDIMGNVTGNIHGRVFGNIYGRVFGVIDGEIKGKIHGKV